jgi:hypothetical protein
MSATDLRPVCHMADAAPMMLACRTVLARVLTPAATCEERRRRRECREFVMSRPRVRTSRLAPETGVDAEGRAGSLATAGFPWVIGRCPTLPDACLFEHRLDQTGNFHIDDGIQESARWPSSGHRCQRSSLLRQATLRPARLLVREAFRPPLAEVQSPLAELA